MPLYQIEHICDLSNEEQDRLAEAITRIHCEKFTVPRIFVNVSFKPKTANTYVAGKHHKSNTITGVLREGPSRTKADFDEVSQLISEAWDSIIASSSASAERKLGAVWILGGVLSAREQGFLVPRAGEEAQWVRENLAGFQKQAQSGNEVFADLVKDLEGREAFRGAVAGAEG